MSSEISPGIGELYHDSSVFVTGGSGFLGKLIISKLFLSFPTIRRVYILLRPKKGKSVEDRCDELFNDIIFSKLRECVPDFRKRISVVIGDCEIPGLGLSQEHRAMLVDDADIIIHSAATVRFNEPLKTAININVSATKSIMSIAKEMKHLKSYVHISTAYSNCHVQSIREEFYDFEMNYEDLLQLAKTHDDDYIDSITPQLLGKRPNTYVFTKAAAEQVIQKEGSNLPVCVFRPSIVLSTLKDPVQGWTANIYGPTGLVVGCAVGCIKVIPCRKTCVSDVVPADMVVNAVLAASWETYKTYQKTLAVEKKASGLPKLYNYVSGARNPITWLEYSKHLSSILWKTGTESALMYQDGVYLQPNLLMYRLMVFLLHLVPAFLFDLYFKYAGKKIRLSKEYQKISQMSEALFYFSTRQWKMEDRNVVKLWESLNPKDKEMFPFDISQLNWKEYLETHLEGIRKYILKESMDPKKAKSHFRRCYRYHFWMKTLSYAAMAAITTFMVKLTF